MTFAEFLENFFGSGDTCLSPGGPVHELSPDFRVMRFPPTSIRNTWVYRTIEMGDVELFTLSSAFNERCVEVLYATAHFFRTATRLDVGHTVNFGVPTMVGGTCEYGLISLPYLQGPDLESGYPGKRVLWLIPITESERDFKKSMGLDALESAFEEFNFDYLDPFRKSVR